MKKFLLFPLAFVALFSISSFAQSGPKIKFDTESIEYGEIAKNADGYRDFKFTNVGDAPLEIKNAAGSCGCTVPTWPKEPIMPGASNVVKVHYATERIGEFNKTVTLTTNETDSQHVLKIHGKVNDLPEAVPADKNNLMDGGK